MNYLSKIFLKIKYSSFFVIVLFSDIFAQHQDSIAVISQDSVVAISKDSVDNNIEGKMNQLRTQLGMDVNAEFDKNAFNMLSRKLISLGINDDQLQDGYDWGGGKSGFDFYLRNNINRILSDLIVIKTFPDSLDRLKDLEFVESSLDTVDEKENNAIEIEQVKGLAIDKNLELPRDNKLKNKDIDNTKISRLSRYNIRSSIAKPLLKGASLETHLAYIDYAVSVKTPIGISLGPIFTSIGFEYVHYSFEKPLTPDNQPTTADTISFFGNAYATALYFDLYKLIKIGKNSIDKQFILGVGKYDSGIGFVNGLVSGFDIAILVGKLPASLFISGRGHIVKFNDIGITYWGTIHAGLGIEIR